MGRGDFRTRCEETKKPKHKIVSKKKRGSGAVALSFFHIHGVFLVSGSPTCYFSRYKVMCSTLFKGLEHAIFTFLRTSLLISELCVELNLNFFGSGSDTLSKSVFRSWMSDDRVGGKWIERGLKLFRGSIVFNNNRYFPISQMVIAGYSTI